MRRWMMVCLLAMLALPGAAATKDTGTTTVKDVQPVGTTDKKRKNLQYDVDFVGSTGMEYTCRTPEKEKMKATDLPVGSQVTYEVKGDKAKLKASSGKETKCTVVRVAHPTSAPK